MQLIRHNYQILILFAALVHLFYWPTWDAGFVTDFTGLMDRIDGQSILGVLNCFGFPAMEQVLNLFLFTFVRLFGASPLPWYLIFTTVHIINGYLLFRFATFLFQQWEIPNERWLALAGSTLFLVSAFQTEVLVWRVCFNFLSVTSMTLLSLIMTFRWVDLGKRRDLLMAHLFFVTGLFIFELALVIPVMGSLLLLLTYNPNKKSLKSLLLQYSIPQFSLVGLYFLLNRLVLGTWIGHYGASVHLRFDVAELFGNFFRYAGKLLFLIRYFDHPIKEKIFQSFNNPILLWPLVMLGILATLGFVVYFKKLSPKWRATGLFLFLFLIALLPVINLYFNYLLHIENDRYGYLASCFFFLFLVLLLSRLPKLIFWSLFIIILIANFWFLKKTNQYWAQSTDVYYSLLEDFRWEDRDQVFALNLPDNLQGAPMFRTFSREGSILFDALHFVAGKETPNKVIEVAFYNMTEPGNGVSVQQDSSGTVEVTFDQWGNWWWRWGQGASSYETDQYIFTNEGKSYRLEWKQKPANSVIIFQDSLQWQELK